MADKRLRPTNVIDPDNNPRRKSGHGGLQEEFAFGPIKPGVFQTTQIPRANSFALTTFYYYFFFFSQY
jgi:hypothetical protein